jgi:nucleotide-binding universal stress UspA family protein
MPRILVAIDGSSRSEKALETAIGGTADQVSSHCPCDVLIVK